MNKRLFFFIGMIFLVATLAFAADAVTVEQLSKMTRTKPSKISKMAEAIDKMGQARYLALSKNYEQAIQIFDGITVANNFDYESERDARIEKIETMVLKGDYANAKEAAIQLNAERALNEDFINFIKVMSDFKATGESKYLLNYITQYDKRNKDIIPPKLYSLVSLTYLSRTVRLLEMAGEIDKALSLVELYFSKKSLKFYQSSKTREGFTLLKQALLRDKREGKNIYAQELINTTDYFGFV